MVVGAGSAGTGVGVTLLQAMVGEGLSAEAATNQFVMLDQYGLLGAGRTGLDMHQSLFQAHSMEDGMSLEETVAPSAAHRVHCPHAVHLPSATPLTACTVCVPQVSQFKPTILLGLSGVGGLFTEQGTR